MSAGQLTDVVDEYWPYDGPHDPDTVTTAAAAIDQLARYLANATQPHIAAHTLEYAATVDRIVGSLHSTVHRLAQVTDQLSRRAAFLPDDPGLYHDSGGDPVQAARSAAADLTSTAVVLRDAGDYLLAAQRNTSCLGHNATEDAR